VRWDDVGTIPFDALGAPGWKSRGGGGGPAATSAAPGLHDMPEGRQHAG
jgi:dihydroorotate dehydrogenase electron transfer subunit